MKGRRDEQTQPPLLRGLEARQHEQLHQQETRAQLAPGLPAGGFPQLFEGEDADDAEDEAEGGGAAADEGEPLDGEVGGALGRRQGGFCADLFNCFVVDTIFLLLLLFLLFSLLTLAFLIV